MTKIKLFLLAGLSVLSAVLFALLKGEKAARAKEKLDGAIKARKIEIEANKTMMEGLNNEQTEINKARNADPRKRTDFE